MIDPSDFSALDEFETELPLTRLLTAFSDPLARYTVYYVSEESSVSLDRLADVMTGWTNAHTGELATQADRDRTRLLLYHVHLPLLDSLDVLQFDADARMIRINEHSTPMESFIGWVRGLEWETDE